MIRLAQGFQAEAVIFDFDGVIVDTEPLHHASFQRTLEPLGLHFSWEEYVETYIGFDDRDAFRHAFTAHDRELSSTTLAGLIARKAAAFQEIITSGVTPYPGVVDLVTSLKAAGIPLAICSGALRSDIDPIVRMLRIEDMFDCIITADDVAASKPDPECYLLAYERLSSHHGRTFARAATLAIEDTPAGIAAAVASGISVCAVTNSYPADRLGQATFITDTLSSLL